jgi:hypothetical protein
MKRHHSHYSLFILIAIFVAHPALSADEVQEFEARSVTGISPTITAVGEIQTVDEDLAPRVWGEGRSGAKRYGQTGEESGLCIQEEIEFGLSFAAVSWGAAASACPAGTWVCRWKDYGGTIDCQTARPDGTVDALNCDGSVINFDAEAHEGWVDLSSTTYRSHVKIEDDFSIGSIRDNCKSLPVWCCSEVLP